MIGLIKRLLKRLKKKVSPKPGIETGRRSYSQAGEDMILEFLFNDKGVKDFAYLEIGTNQPDQDNNTYHFYLKGQTGVCVEADKTLIPRIKQLRPRDRIIHAGVSIDDQKEAEFYLFNYKGLNTFSKEEALNRVTNEIFKIVEISKVGLQNINDLIAQNFKAYPTLLAIDIEGLDISVIKSLDLQKYPIPVICAETCSFSINHVRPKDPSISQYLLGKGYEIYADTYVNTIYVNSEWFYSK